MQGFSETGPQQRQSFLRPTLKNPQQQKDEKPTEQWQSGNLGRTLVAVGGVEIGGEEFGKPEMAAAAVFHRVSVDNSPFSDVLFRFIFYSSEYIAPCH